MVTSNPSLILPKFDRVLLLISLLPNVTPLAPSIATAKFPLLVLKSSVPLSHTLGAYSGITTYQVLITLRVTAVTNLLSRNQVVLNNYIWLR